ncbi:MAG TPA: YceK/YidQ family lipoprotein [Fluviicoccus sp.]|nr:YceK/YidQ family lipoprotein [Fluviicoccus sp.]
MKAWGIVLVVTALSGCASMWGVATKDDKARPWFGVKADWYALTHARELGEKTVLLPAVLCPAAAIDLPFSAVSDLLFWPYLSSGRQPAGL